MTKEATILALIATATTGHILFLAMYLWIRSTKHLPNKLLSLLLFCYSLRIIKSVLLLSFPGLPFSKTLIALGVIGMSAIGPLLFFYVQALLNNNFSVSKKLFWHFLPAAILLPSAFFLDDRSMFMVYQFTVYQIFFYLFYSISFFVKAKKKNTFSTLERWIKEIFIAVGCLSFIFLIQLYTTNRNFYVTVSILAAAIFYIISLRGAFGKNAFSLFNKKKTKTVKNFLLPTIENKLKKEQLFLDSQLTVSKLAAALNISAHTLSVAINEGSGMSFNEYLNNYRIQEAAMRLSTNDYAHFSIEGIAYDCGFNSLSAFYNAFKKVYKTTPAKFRQQSFPDSENQEDFIQNPVRI
ncbi:MAG TPA: AraC family transcriptional regulator [Chitinophagaceae bacterium]|nr:AraC family transcriptional regulator [Chitinophagaceae bacterium]